jgi:acetylornithine deacetylase/succinyl-diaminopimelate desuccinylase-like protein
MITEGDEETGGHIEHYIQTLKDRIGTPEVIFCLDSGALDYERFWNTSSLRGYISGVLKVRILKEGVHSGDASGIVPSAYRILNKVLARLENVETGEINKQFEVNIPGNRYSEAYDLVENLSKNAVKPFPFFNNTKPISENILDLVLGRTWKPQLTVTGLSGLPQAETAGNVLLPEVSVKLSLRIPPTLDSASKAK